MRSDGNQGKDCTGLGAAEGWRGQREGEKKKCGPILGERDSEGLGGLGSEAGDRIRPL